MTDGMDAYAESLARRADNEPAAELRGTFACPVCGKETPHPHSQEQLVARIRQLEAELAAAKAQAQEWEFRYGKQGEEYALCRERLMIRSDACESAEQSLAALQARIEEAGKGLPPEPSRDVHWCHTSSEWMKYTDTLRQQYTDLLAKSKAGEEDARRIDFIEKHSDGVVISGSGAADDKWFEVIYNDGNRAEGETFRAAIDQAAGGGK